MKKIKKALALVLALAMIATVVPVASTEAASTAKLSATTATIAAGSKKVITLTTPSTWKKVKTSWKVGKKSVAQIVAVTKKASVRAQAAGETNVKVKVTYAKSTKKGAKRYSKSLYCKVTVKDILFKSVKQTKYNTLEATVDGKTSGLKAADVKIVNKANNNVVAVQSVSVDAADASKVTITTFANLTDGATYVVTIDGVEKEITVSDGTVADVAVSPLQITADTEGTTIKAQLVDKNGVVINEFTTAANSKPANVDFTLSTTQGYVGTDKDGANTLVLPIAGNKGTAEVTYHTYKYDEKAQEVGAISKKFEIVAVASSPATISGYNYTIGSSAPDWDKVKAVNTFPISDSVNAYFYFVDSNKKDVTNQYSVVSSDSSVLLLPKTPLTDKTTGIKLVAVKTGSAYINVLKDDKVVTSLPVTITDARKLSNITLDVSAVTVSNADNALSADVNVKSVDQTGSEIALESLTAKVLGSNQPVVGTPSADKKKLTISAIGAKTGTYTLKIEAKKGDVTIARTVSVTVVATDKTVTTATDLRLSVSPSEIDLAIADDATDTKKDIKVSVVAYDKGAKLGEVALKSVKCGDKDITDFNGDNTIATIDATKFKAASYTVTAVALNAAGKDQTFSSNITIKNTQVAATVKVVNNEYSGTVTDKDGAAAATMLKSKKDGNDIVEFYYNGKKLDSADSSFDVTVDDDQVKANGTQVYIGTAKVQVKNSKGTRYFVDATVNSTFTLK